MELDTTPDFSLLPPHVIGTIFQFLNFRQRLNAARTCKSWYFGSCDPIIWKSTKAKFDRRLYRYRLDQLNRPCGTVKLESIDFNIFTYYPEFFTKFGRFIRHLNLCYCDLTMQQLLECLSLTTNLTSLTIMVRTEMFNMKEIFTNDEQASFIKNNLNSLKSFTVHLASSNSDGLQVIMSMMKNLDNFSISSTDYCTSYVFKYLFEYFNTFSDVICLNRLRIGSLDRECSEMFLNDFSKINNKLNIHEVSLQSICGLNLTRDYDVKFNVFCEKLSNVRVFTMQSIGDKQLRHICFNMTQLIELNLFISEAQKVRCIGNLPNLQKLSMDCSYYHEGFEEEELVAMFKKLRHLTELRLDINVEDGILNEICRSCTNLTVLKLGRVRTNKFSSIFRNLSKLKALHLSIWANEPVFTSDCDITNLKLLEKLDISMFAPGMTIDLIEKLPNLRPESLLHIKEKLQNDYLEPEIESAYTDIVCLFDQ